MKTCLPLFLSLSFAGVASAQTVPAAPPISVAPATSSIVAPSIVAPGAVTSPSNSWLASRGMLSVDDLSALTGAQFSPAERAKLEIVVAARNAELERLNAQLSAQLGQILREGDAQIATRIETKAARGAEAERMERLKRLQPSRYQEMMRRKRATEKGAAQGNRS